MDFDLPPITLPKEKDALHSHHTQKDEVKPVTSYHFFNVMPGKNGTDRNPIWTNPINSFDAPPNFGNDEPYSERESGDTLTEEVLSNQQTLLDFSSRKLTNIPNIVMSLNNLVVRWFIFSFILLA